MAVSQLRQKTADESLIREIMNTLGFGNNKRKVIWHNYRKSRSNLSRIGKHYKIKEG